MSRRSRHFNKSWWGLAPFVLYALGLLLVPAAAVLLRAFRTDTGSFTLQNVRDMGAHQYVVAFRTSITLSILSAVVGVVFGGDPRSAGGIVYAIPAHLLEALLAALFTRG